MKKLNEEKLFIQSQAIPDVKLITHKSYLDERGCLERMFCSKELSSILNHNSILQINRTRTSEKGTIRGMHFQHRPFQENKIVQCIKGRIFDVVVDLRSNSNTYMQNFSIELSESKMENLFIPEGFAHGFQALTNDVELIYFHTNYYNSDFENGINPLDKLLNLNWPLKLNIISKRDSSFKPLNENQIKKGFDV